jgi:NAD+ kinase
MQPEPVSLAAPVRRVGLVAKSRLREAAALLDEIAEWLEQRGVETIFEEATAELAAGGRAYQTARHEDLPARSDLILVLGGDGTLLAVANRIAHAGARVPILGVNFGSLGFLTEVTLAELYSSLESVTRGTAQLDERLMLRCLTLDGRGEPIDSTIVLNDVVVTRGTVSRVIDLSVTVDDEFVARFKADGIIVATPTGSTAYNLAAGGPIVYPSMEALVLTPIAPHTLTNRPVVIPASAVVRIQPVGYGLPQEIHATFDGQSSRPLRPDDLVVVKRAAEPLLIVRAATRNYFDVLRRKLKWAER